jgi:hypothetical protein
VPPAFFCQVDMPPCLGSSRRALPLPYGKLPARRFFGGCLFAIHFSNSKGRKLLGSKKKRTHRSTCYDKRRANPFHSRQLIIMSLFLATRSTRAFLQKVCLLSIVSRTVEIVWVWWNRCSGSCSLNRRHLRDGHHARLTPSPLCRFKCSPPIMRRLSVPSRRSRKL